jgi:hypothetical protein
MSFLYIYLPGGVFEKRQQEHRTAMNRLYSTGYQRTMTVLKNIYKHFKDGSAEVQREWKSQINQVSS